MTRQGAVLIALVYFASVVFLRLPRIRLIVEDISERTVLFEALTIGCGALVLAGIPWARVPIGISMMVFGVDHLQIPRFISTLIPSWIPGPFFWACFTGLAFIAAGLSMVTGWQMRQGAMALGLMFFLWVVLVHAPRVAASPGNGNEWNSLLVALTMSGASALAARLHAHSSPMRQLGATAEDRRSPKLTV
jgi:uncharacterized membrane protein